MKKFLFLFFLLSAAFPAYSYVSEVPLEAGFHGLEVGFQSYSLSTQKNGIHSSTYQFSKNQNRSIQRLLKTDHRVREDLFRVDYHFSSLEKQKAHLGGLLYGYSLDEEQRLGLSIQAGKIQKEMLGNFYQGNIFYFLQDEEHDFYSTLYFGKRTKTIRQNFIGWYSSFEKEFPGEYEIFIPRGIIDLEMARFQSKNLNFKKNQDTIKIGVGISAEHEHFLDVKDRIKMTITPSIIYHREMLDRKKNIPLYSKESIEGGVEVGIHYEDFVKVGASVAYQKSLKKSKESNTRFSVGVTFSF
ncbi:hypothetical protein [Fusobacterium necrophorum]|uniref:hypothetical protein n=1 Tax=Fusobacterium necrophorum TaxID=859 RepID=UPI00370DF851